MFDEMMKSVYKGNGDIDQTAYYDVVSEMENMFVNAMTIRPPMMRRRLKLRRNTSKSDTFLNEVNKVSNPANFDMDEGSILFFFKDDHMNIHDISGLYEDWIHKRKVDSAAQEIDKFGSIVMVKSQIEAQIEAKLRELLGREFAVYVTSEINLHYAEKVYEPYTEDILVLVTVSVRKI